jgi:hypothetical protein
MGACAATGLCFNTLLAAIMDTDGALLPPPNHRPNNQP